MKICSRNRHNADGRQPSSGSPVYNQLENSVKFKNLFLLLMALSLISGPGLSYAKDKQLPPGLQKKHQRGQALPPGWQKKLAKGDILDNSIFDAGRVVVPLAPDGSISINVEGTILRIHEKTREILDILHP